ncbi:MAG: hypothetical protein H7Z13_14455 [Ferruginibacter sp.]|nr:hypothetical protein [Ferruginibacter sp.]
MKKLILKIDGIFLMVMGSIAALADLAGYLSGKGPFGKVYYNNVVVIGGFEAHCLAVVLGFTLFAKHKSADPIFFIKIAVVIHALLGISNLVWFKVFYETATVPMGYIATIAHFAFVLLHTTAIYKGNK